MACAEEPLHVYEGVVRERRVRAVKAIHGGRVERAHRLPRGEVARGHDDVIDVRARDPAPKGEAAR
eukprot:scaffold18074_cov38-Phaeocystis_antarctica.AAC.1